MRKVENKFEIKEYEWKEKDKKVDNREGKKKNEANYY
jgi:hypothetical protein